MNPVPRHPRHGRTGPEGMAEYQQMKPAGHSAAGHVSGLNLKSAPEHESSPQQQNGTHTCASDLKKCRNT